MWLLFGLSPFEDTLGIPISWTTLIPNDGLIERTGVGYAYAAYARRLLTVIPKPGGRLAPEVVSVHRKSSASHVKEEVECILPRICDNET